MLKSNYSIAILVAAMAFPALPSQAGSRYATPPPLTLSPDLTNPWVLQLGTGNGSRIRTRPAPVLRNSYNANAEPRRSQIQPRTTKRKAVRQSKRLQNTASLAPVKRKKNKNRRTFDAALLPTVVDYDSPHRPGTIVIDTIERRLYHVMSDGKARRYGVGVGKPGFEWAGTHKVTRKAEWPSWTPPAEMRAREKKKGRILPKTMKGGPRNPLGARALYLGSTLYRIHGSNQPWSIGRAVSSGCIRMRNEDVMDLYERVKVGAKVIVL